jgi:hypothetical protein
MSVRRWNWLRLEVACPIVQGGKQAYSTVLQVHGAAQVLTGGGLVDVRVV